MHHAIHNYANRFDRQQNSLKFSNKYVFIYRLSSNYNSRNITLETNHNLEKSELSKVVVDAPQSAIIWLPVSSRVWNPSSLLPST